MRLCGGGARRGKDAPVLVVVGGLFLATFGLLGSHCSG